MIWHSDMDMANTWGEIATDRTFSRSYMYGAAQRVIWRKREHHDKLAVCILDIHLIQIFEHRPLSPISAGEMLTAIIPGSHRIFAPWVVGAARE